MSQNPTVDGDHRSPTFSRHLNIWRRHRVLIVVSCLLAAGTAYALSSSAEKRYTATTSLLFRDPQLDRTLFGVPFFGGAVDPARDAATNVKLVSLSAVARRTARALREDPAVATRARRHLGARVPLSEDVIGDNVAVAPEGQSDLVSVSYTDTSPKLSALVANVFAAQYISFRREADRDKIGEARDLVERQLAAMPAERRRGTEGRSLQRRGEQLAILESLQTGNAEVVQAAGVPASASSPRPRRTTAVAGFVGLLLGLALAFLFERLNRRIRDDDEVAEIFKRPIVGSIPEVRGRRRGPLSPVDADAYRLTRANLRYFNVNRELKSILVTSAAPGEGKTTIAFNLAAVAAEGGSKVLLIETDLRRPTMAQRFMVDPIPGLSTLLASDLAFEQAVQHVDVQTITGAAGLERQLDVLTAGPLPPNPADLLESDRMRDIIRSAEENYDLVVIDTPPTSVVSDAIPLIRHISGVLVVARVGQSTYEGLERLQEQLGHLDAPVIGVVVNGMRDKDASYGYGYSGRDGYAAAQDADDFMALVNGVDGAKPADDGPAQEPRRRRLLRR